MKKTTTVQVYLSSAKKLRKTQKYPNEKMKLIIERLIKQTFKNNQ